MKTVVELKQERASLVQEQTGLVEKARTENRELKEAEETRFDAIQTEIESLDKSIKRAEAAERNAAAASAGKNAVVVGADGVEAPKQERFSILRAIKRLSSGKALEGVEAEVHNEQLESLRSQGVSVPEGAVFCMPLESRAQSVSDDAGAKGGALVASTPKLVQPLQPNLPITDLGVTVMSGLVGDVPLPTNSGFSLAFVGETGAAGNTDASFAGPTLKPKRISGTVDISNKLLLQTSFDIEAYIIGQINIALGNLITSAAINGAGGDAPTGLYSLITTNINVTATAPTHDIIVDLEGMVDAADGTSVSRGYLSDTKIRAKAKVTKVDAGSGIFLTDGKELNGYKYTASTLVPTLDAGVSHPLIFGDWAQMFVGTWGSVSIKVDPYTQAANGKTRLVIEAFADVAVTNEKAFAINKVLTV